MDARAGAPHVRLAGPDDAAAIREIYNQGIEDRVATFETEPRTTDQIRAWFDDEGHPAVVAVDGGRVVAFGSLSGYRPRTCYAGIAEFSIYVRRGHRGNGLGRRTLAALVEAARERGHWKLVSRIFVENEASRRICAITGFREVGVYRKHARLDGVWRDVVVVERLIDENLT